VKAVKPHETVGGIYFKNSKNTKKIRRIAPNRLFSNDLVPLNHHLADTYSL